MTFCHILLVAEGLGKLIYIKISNGRVVVRSASYYATRVHLKISLICGQFPPDTKKIISKKLS